MGATHRGIARTRWRTLQQRAAGDAMKILKTIIAATVGLVGGPPAVADPEDEGRKIPNPHPPGICEETLGPQIEVPAGLPDDPAIPALKAIREEGLASILPATLLMGAPVETSLRG